jgi:lipopolysaccharide biosynthesis regulator YciM
VNTLNLLWLLLPVAAAGGWWAALRSRRQTIPVTTDWLKPDYFRGIQHILNEESDQAVTIFSRMLETRSDLIDIHLVLGSLLRQRGETERAVRLHQNVLARPDLTTRQQAQVLLELGRDYLQAGLLDRAEALFQDLCAKKQCVPEALRHLRTLYLHEKAWLSCLQTSEALEKATNEDLSLEKSHFFCELATQAQRLGQIAQTKFYLKRALRMHPGCVRANHLLGQLAWQAKKYRAALSHWQQTVRDDPSYLPEVWPDLFQAHQTLDKLDELNTLIADIGAAVPASGTAPYRAEVLQQCADQATASDMLLHAIQQTPTLSSITTYLQQHPAQTQTPELKILTAALQHIQQQQPQYQCRQCGFQSHRLHWQCPRCSTWGSIRRP